MTALYATLILLVVAAFFGMLHIRRVADRRWRMHVLLRPLAKDWVRFQIVVRDQLTPAVRQMADRIAEMGPVLKRFGDAMREAEK